MIKNILKFLILFVIVAVICSIDVIEAVVFDGNDFLFLLVVVALGAVELLYFRWKDNR